MRGVAEMIPGPPKRSETLHQRPGSCDLLHATQLLLDGRAIPTAVSSAPSDNRTILYDSLTCNSWEVYNLQLRWAMLKRR